MRKLLRLLAVVALAARGTVAPAQTTSPETTPASTPGEPVVQLERFVHEERREDPLNVIPNRESESAFGFNKSIQNTPRSISYISGEVIDALSLSAVEDLARVVPGVFTVTRPGIQGGVDVRNVPADTYFRGMKRIDLQGHGRSVLAAIDSSMTSLITT